MLVWLTDWQLAEHRLLISIGDVVDWTVYRADRDWVARLFGDRLTIEWQLDTYGDAMGQPSRHVSGHVIELRSVRCRQVRTAEGIVPAAGEAILQPVTDTSGSWQAHERVTENSASSGAGTFAYTSASDGLGTNALYGYVLSLR